jgi:hypothetical protein
MIEQFKRLFMVLDAIRVSKKKMGEMMGTDKLQEYIEKFALYSIELV